MADDNLGAQTAKDLAAAVLGVRRGNELDADTVGLPGSSWWSQQTESSTTLLPDMARGSGDAEGYEDDEAAATTASGASSRARERAWRRGKSGQGDAGEWVRPPYPAVASRGGTRRRAAAQRAPGHGHGDSKLGK